MYIYHIATQDVISLDLFKDEILTINNSNSVSFIPVNDEVNVNIHFLLSIAKTELCRTGIYFLYNNNNRVF